MIDSSLHRGDMQDTLRRELLSYGVKDVPITIDDLVGKTGLSASQIYQSLYRLQNKGEIKLIKEEDSSRPRIISIELQRMEPIETISARVDERQAEKIVHKDVNKLKVQIPNTISYIEKRIAIYKAREEVAKVNIDPDSIVRFDPDPLGEEAVFLLQQLQESLLINTTLTNDLEAERRNASHYKQMLATRTYGDSGT